MIIGTCGFCSTGSSAVSDYLKEFDENQVLDMLEFTLPYLPDGLEDLEYHLTKNINRIDSSVFSIERFRMFMKSKTNGELTKLTSLTKEKVNEITESFIDKIVQLRWKFIGRGDELLYPSKFYRYFGLSIMAQRVLPWLNKKKGRSIDLYPVRELEVSIMPDNFEAEAKRFIKNILIGMGADFTKNIVLDQPFSGDDPAKTFHYFDNPLAIVVDRDPRDNYLFAKKFLYKKGRFMPTDSVKEFVKYYRLVRDNRPYKNEDSRILKIKFEDMVYNYDETTKKINKFCGLGENPRPFTVFNPKLSIANTQLKLRYPEYSDDIKYIEDNLTEYLFNFEDYPTPDISGKMFMGKSPLNK